MKVPTTLVAAGATLLIAGCGAAGAASSPTPGSANGAQGQGRRGAAGELAKIDSNTLILNSQNGDVTVQITPATPVQKTSTGTVADIVAGACMVATGQKDASGGLTAQVVRISAKQNGTCSLGRPGGGPGGLGPDGGRRNGTPAVGGPGGSPNPGGGGRNANFAFAAGEVTTVNGTSVIVQPATGPAQTITVPTTVRVSRSAPAVVSDLAVGQCVQAGGTRDSSGMVKATNLSIVPPGPSGCFTGSGIGGRRGVGGGGAGLGRPPGD
ncbi:MAG: hypothetical protein ABR564_04955 [Candidatus Dormibacteria bacterium]